MDLPEPQLLSMESNSGGGECNLKRIVNRVMIEGCPNTASPMTLLGPDGQLSSDSRVLESTEARVNWLKMVEW